MINIIERLGKIEDYLFRVLYWFISTIDKEHSVRFMNYGYSNNGEQITLMPEDEPDRYSAQLYDFVVSEVGITQKKILEVGSGRGGGLSFLTRYHAPDSATGVELSKKAVDFCTSYYHLPDLNFVAGNAEKLSFDDDSFDVILNVESSHRYHHFENFLSGVHRILKPDGHFLIADFRVAEELDETKAAFKDAGFLIQKFEIITPHVLESLILSRPHREQQIKGLLPSVLHGLAKNFASSEGSEMFERFKNGSVEYFFASMVKT